MLQSCHVLSLLLVLPVHAVDADEAVHLEHIVQYPNYFILPTNLNHENDKLQGKN